MIKDTLYAKYIKECEGFEVLENESGFLFYKIRDGECFLAHVFTEAEARKTGRARSLIDEVSEVAIKNDCEVVSASIDLRDKNASKTLAAALRVGFEVKAAEHGVMIIVKPLEKGVSNGIN